MSQLHPEPSGSSAGPSQSAAPVRRGWEGAVLKLMRAKDFTLTVTGREQVGESFVRVHCTDGGLLAANELHPTMWVRLWFDDEGKGHQRGYTLVDPDPQAGTFALEFALHDGIATDWARAASPGTSIECTVQGSKLVLPTPAPRAYELVGDAASMPAVNSLLDAIGEVPARLTLEFQHESEQAFPLRLRSAHEVQWVRRTDDGAGLVARVRSTWTEPGLTDAYVWVACDTRTTRAIAAIARKEFGVPKERVSALGYWQA